MYDTTNTYRAWHQAPLLDWDPALAAQAASYAQRLAAEDCGVRHSDGALAGQYGENTYSVVSYPYPDGNCGRAADTWYNVRGDKGRAHMSPRSNSSMKA